jgi:hypothetical protein
LAATGFVAAGIGLFVSQAWWRPAVIAAAAFSSVIFVLFWSGGIQDAPNKGLIAILINLAILVSLLALKWPRLGF